MYKRALLIGSPFGDLTGPLSDIERVAQLLTTKGFDIRRCVGSGATREEILGAYRELIEDAGRGDVCAVYYSGHGARSLDEAYTPPDENAPPKLYHHFIVPMDLEESSEGDFRGILSLELSSLLAQLTAKTRNVTVIFDCCHSGGMTRDFRLKTRGLSKEWFVGAFNHLERLRRGEIQGFPLDDVAIEGNPFAVRVMAALPSQQAWEYEDDQGAYGLMTDALIKAFVEAGDYPVTWNAIQRRLRELVQQHEPGQHPDIEGPISRFVFELEEAELTGVVPIELSDDGPRLQAGRLLGIEVGDEYMIMPPGFQKIDPGKALGRVTVSYVSGAWSSVAFDHGSSPINTAPGLMAFPLSRTYHRKPVILRVGPQITTSLKESISKSKLLRLPADDDAENHDDALAVVEEREGRLFIREQDDRDLISPLEVSPDTVNMVVENLGRLARARQLETLQTGFGNTELTSNFALDWGRIVAGTPKPLPTNGALLFVGEHVFVRIRNNSPTMLYVSVFDIGLAGKIELLTWAPSGVEIHPDGDALLLGHQEGVGWKGIGPIAWPEEVPKDGRPRPESLVVVISDHPQDLRALKSPGMAAPKGAEVERSELQRLTDQFSTGRTRELPQAKPPPSVRYSVQHIKFMVDPTVTTIHFGSALSSRETMRGNELASSIPAVAVPDLASFLIDERPQPSVAYRHARGLEISSAIALQLGEIVVHSNRALFSSDVRVDALVVTCGDNIQNVYHAGVQRFERIKDGDRLPLDNLIIYHGPVNGFIDLAVWVSRDDGRNLTLSDLIKDQINSIEFSEAALVLTQLAIAAPAAGAIVAGFGAATTIVNIAYKLLSSAVGKNIGLYRTSFLANDGFGVGRHPVNGTLRAQDFSFWYQIKKI